MRRTGGTTLASSIQPTIDSFRTAIGGANNGNTLMAVGSGRREINWDGGGLTMATLLALRDRKLPRPVGGVCISPWVDLTCSGASYATRASADPIVTREGIEMMAQAYVGNGDRKSPLVSPLFADLHDLPPLLIQVGSDEVLLDDSLVLGRRALAAGVSVKVEEWPTMVHVWHWFLPMLDEAPAAIARIGDFAQARTA